MRNIAIGIMLLIILLALLGPDGAPRLISSLIPSFFEGVPCDRLRTASDRANHQSLIGRGAPNPIAVNVQTSPIPATADGFLTIQIIVTNISLGTVAFVYNPNQVIVGDNGSSGLGIIFSPPNSLSTGVTRQDNPNPPESDLRLLGPRQRCVHVLEFPAGNVLVEPQLAAGQTQVRAYYRNNNRGSITQPPNTFATPIFTDAGLWTGVVESPNITIPRAGG
jgi:hypothetical protein